MTGPAVFGPDVYASRRDLNGRIVTVLRGVTDRRGLEIGELRSRAAPRGVIHELMTTDEPAAFGSVVNRVALLCFFEVEAGSVILVGDEVYAGNTLLGTVAGFNETHMPNHLNICLQVTALLDGESIGLSVEDAIRFVPPETPESTD
jgi:hypothetical protein